MNVFTCCICKHQWSPVDPKEAKHIAKAVEVNGTGPYCELCRALTEARRVAEVRRINFAKFVKGWQPMANRYDAEVQRARDAETTPSP